jgi:type I restriction enzyme S subunit
MSFPRYPKYKSSNIEWLREVPVHWEVKKLKHVSPQLTVGIVVEPSKLYTDEGVPALRSLNVKAGAITLDNLVFITQAGHELHPKSRLRAGDIVAVRTGQPGASAVIPQELDGCNCIDLIVIRKPVAGSERFLCWYLGADPALVQFSTGSGGAIQQHFNISTAANLIVTVPPLAEQTAIAAFLGSETAKIDALVTEQQRLIELLNEKRQAVISHAITKGLSPDTPMKPSGVEWLGKVPAHWEVRKIKHLACSIEQGWSPQCEGGASDLDSEWGVLKVGCVNGGTFNPFENKLLPSEMEPIPSLAIRAGDLLVSRANTRELVGSAAVAERDYPRLMLCDKLYRIRLMENLCWPKFVCYYLEVGVVREQIELAATGASSSMLNIGQSAIMDLVIAFPSLKEQSEILSYLERELAKLDTLTAEAQRAIDLLQERRAALISAAVTGQIDVRGIANRYAA